MVKKSLSTFLHAYVASFKHMKGWENSRYLLKRPQARRGFAKLSRIRPTHQVFR